MKYVKVLRVIISISFLLMTAVICNGQDRAVVPIDWSSFNSKKPDSPEAIKWQNLLSLTTKNILNEQWDELVGDHNLDTYFELGEKYNTAAVRPFAQYAYAIATIISLNEYDSSLTEHNLAIRKATTMIKSIAKAHQINGGSYDKKWGDSWQSAHWASTTAISAWLIWRFLELEDRYAVRRMLEFEANRFIDLIPIPANEEFLINTRSEDNGWDAWCLETAAAMMPNHPNANLWRSKSIEYRITAIARREDLNDSVMVDQRPVSFWMSGFNVSEQYAVGNHGAYPHPDYSATVVYQSLRGILIWNLARIRPTQACLYNQQDLYRMFVDTKWNEESSIYREDGTIYWPIEIEMDRSTRYYKYAAIDALASLIGTDSSASIQASEWEKIHLNKLIEQQDMMSGEINTDAGMHETAFSIATAYIAHWLSEQGLLIPSFPIESPVVLGESQELPLLVYPIPAEETLYFGSQQHKIQKIEIFGMSGDLRLKRSAKNSRIDSIDISGLHNGTYFIKITLDDESVYSQRIVVRK